METSELLGTLRHYANGRKNAVNRGLETGPIAALLLEKYAIGLVDCIRTLKLQIDINVIANEADALCKQIDSNFELNRHLRYQRVARLDLSQQRNS